MAVGIYKVKTIVEYPNLSATTFGFFQSSTKVLRGCAVNHIGEFKAIPQFSELIENTDRSDLERVKAFHTHYKKSDHDFPRDGYI